VRNRRAPPQCSAFPLTLVIAQTVLLKYVLQAPPDSVCSNVYLLTSIRSFCYCLSFRSLATAHQKVEGTSLLQTPGLCTARINYSRLVSLPRVKLWELYRPEGSYNVNALTLFPCSYSRAIPFQRSHCPNLCHRMFSPSRRQSPMYSFCVECERSDCADVS